MTPAAPPEASERAAAVQMLRTLLAERFQLKWHLETKSLPVYVLGVDNRTLKLTNVEAGSGSVIS